MNTLVKTLKKYQQDGVDRIVSQTNTLIADEPGLGKTIQVLAYIDQNNVNKTLIVCPSSLKLNWENEIGEWIKTKKLNINVISKGTDTLKDDDNIIIVSYNLVGTIKGLNSLYFDLLVCDESHYLRSPKAKRSKIILGLHGLYKQAKKVVCLTGTPLTIDPLDTYLVTKRLAPKETLGELNDYHKYTERYCSALYVNGLWEIGKPSNVEELRQKLGPFLLRRTAKDVRDNQVKVKYTYPKCKESVKLDVNEELHVILKMTAETKYPLTCKLLDLYTNVVGVKVVLFCYHRHVISHFLTKYKDKAVKLDGSMSADKKHKAIQDFIHEDSIQIFIGQIRASGVGLNGLQHASSVCIFHELPWTYTDYGQAVGRLDRIGQTSSIVNVITPVLKGSLDYIQLKRINERNDFSSSFLEGETTGYESYCETNKQQQTTKEKQPWM